MPQTFFTSDLHFGHKNIIRYCNRPFADTDEMDASLIASWNARVAPEDTVYVLGDVSFRNATQSRALVTQLNGHKKLIRGNHDRGVNAMLAMGFTMCAPEGMLFTEHGKVLMVHNPEFALQHPILFDVSLVLCGHVHTFWRTKLLAGVRFINVGTDVWDYRPVTLTELLTAPGMPEPQGATRQVSSAYL